MLVGISGDDFDEFFSVWVVKKIVDFGEIMLDKVYVFEFKAGVEYKIGGVWVL